jgi:hypothetical protein
MWLLRRIEGKEGSEPSQLRITILHERGERVWTNKTRLRYQYTAEKMEKFNWLELVQRFDA